MSCPNITPEAMRHYKQAMKTHLQCFKETGKSIHGDKNGLVDDLKGCEVAFIGHDYTWHTHPVGIEPSKADIMTNQKLGKRWLCIGHAPTGKTHCFDLFAKEGMKKSCVF